MRHLICLITLSFLISNAFAQVQSPSEFLGYELGDKFTRHSDVIRYFEHLASVSDQVKLEDYGKTYEGRRLILVTLSSVENMENLEGIRQDNLRRTGLLDGAISTKTSIVWLSYNVHGDEANSTEASMATIYELLSNADLGAWLKNTVVIIDPCVNPDGRDRYVNFYNQYGNLPYNTDPQSIEHRQPWPGGRVNHYLFDLNRDWAWQTQIESQQRLKVYNQWMPHVHVDFHEQGINSPYYFAPGAEPLHEQITGWQREFQETIGRNHAKYFDRNNWFYFTKQRFDLLYPSYGDTYPMFNGSIGMTYEQAGSGRGGLGVVKQEGDILTLLDRLTRHKTTGLSTIEVTSQNAERVISEFENYFKTPVKGKHKSYVLKYGGDDKFAHLRKWLDTNGIIYGSASNQKGLKGFHYESGKDRSFTISSRDLVISTDQPKGLLAKVLFEPTTKVVDSVTYDITAWSVPYFYGLEAYATSMEIDVTPVNRETRMPTPAGREPVYACLFRWESLRDAKFLSKLLDEGFKVRFSEKTLKIGGNTFNPGTLVVARRDNNTEDFNERIYALANQYEQTPFPIASGFMDAVPDIGSGDIRFIDAPRIAMIAGEVNSRYGVGSFWHFMEQELNYPTSMIWSNELGSVNLSRYDILVMPNGRYSEYDNDELESIKEWVSAGGKLILIQGAIKKFVDSGLVKLSQYNSQTEKDENVELKALRKEDRKLVRYEDQERNQVKDNIPGAVFKVTLDNSHPMAFGYPDKYYSLKTSSSRYGYLDSQNVGILKNKNDHLSGFVGKNVLEDVGESMIFGVENVGKGEIIYFVDDVLFRAFWYNGKLLMANSLFFVGN